MELIASAPGKVFVVGEYAVIGGGPAVVATVNRRLRARVRARRGRGVLVVRCGGSEGRCSLGAERVDELPRDTRFVAGAALVAARAFGLQGFDLDIETESDLDRGASKTGLGGSAAATAATVAAIHGIIPDGCGGTSEATRVAAGLYAHRLVQGGGSGADVIAATVGGLVWVDGLDGRDVPRDVSECVAHIHRAPGPSFERLELPDGLAIDVVSTGRSCATAPRVARYGALALQETTAPASATIRAWAERMRNATEMFRTGCRAADASMVLGAVRAAAMLLSRLGGLAGIPIFTTELRRACAIASAIPGAAAKPSGAGGGDCAIAVLGSDLRAQLRQLWKGAGLQPLEVELDRAGARCEVTT